MKQWTGIDDGRSIVGDGLTAATGLSFYVAGEAQRRPGLTYLGGYGALQLAHFKSPMTGSWLLLIEASGSVRSLKLSDASSTQLATGYAVDKVPNVAVVGPRVYVTNDFDRVKMWDGLASALRDAGIAAPTGTMAGPTSTAAGTCTVGLHFLRYRYVDSTSPGGAYRSNAGTAFSYTVASGQQALTFSVGVAGNIVPSTDPKVDTIEVEMTAVNGTTYFVAATCANTATSVVVNIADDLLQLQDSAALYGETGHEQPPLGAVIFESKGYAFMCGFHARTVTATVTNGSAAVTGTGFSTLWAGRLFRAGTDPQVYVIASVASSTAMTLEKVYAGTTRSVACVVTSGSPNRAYWSEAELPESFRLAVRGRDVLMGSGDSVVGGCEYLGDSYFFGQRSMCRLVFTSDPVDGELFTVSAVHGLWNQRCLIEVEGQLYGLGPNGAWMLSGGRPRWISKPVDTTLSGLLDRAYVDLIHARYDPVQKVLRWWFVATGATVPNYAIAYDLQGQRWSIHQYRQGIDASALYTDDNGRIRLAVADKTQGRTYIHEGITDGAPVATTGSYTADGGATTSVIPVTVPLPTGTGLDLSGLMLTQPSSGESRAIASNTGSAITLASPLTTAPTVGQTIHVGSIPWSITTDWWDGRGMDTKKRAHLFLHFIPSTAGELVVRVYRDFSDTPHVWTTGDGDRWPNGVTVLNGYSYLTVTMDAATTSGFVTLPMPAEWSRVLRASVECVSPLGTLRLLDVRFEITEPEEEGEEDEE